MLYISAPPPPQGCLPSICDCPEVGGVGDTAVLLQWRPPLEDGGTQVLGYHLQYKSNSGYPPLYYIIK